MNMAKDSISNFRNGIVGIIGLGLIGGSLARAYKKAGLTVLGHDIDERTTDFAVLANAIDADLTDERLSECDLILIATPPEQAIHWFEHHASMLSTDSIIIDCCGTKRALCETCGPIAQEFGLTYMGGHPMAGTEFYGFKHSKADMFVGSTFVLVPQDPNDIELIDHVKQMLLPIGIGKIAITTAEHHDRAIAFTSQMPHIISNGFIKNGMDLMDDTVFTGGSYKDMTRVASLDEKIWSQLFLENRDFLVNELRSLISELTRYEQAIEAEDRGALESLLLDGKNCKQAFVAQGIGA